MNIREKTALVATGSNVLLTILKFTGAFLTGSQAILAEALHSFSLAVASDRTIARQAADADLGNVTQGNRVAVGRPQEGDR